MRHLEIKLGSTYLRTKVLESHPIFGPIRQLVRSKASVWRLNPRFRRWEIVAEFYTYNPVSGILRLPIGYLNSITELCQSNGVTVSCTEDVIIEPRLIDISLKPGIISRPHQIDPINFFSSPTGLPRRGLELQTGKGKTFVTIASIANLGCASIIICAGLTDLWLRELSHFVNCDDIYLIQTRQSLEKLFSSGALPSLFVASLGTLRLYSQAAEAYRALPMNYPQFLEHFGIGIKVIDEVHLNAHAVTQLDLFANVKFNWYLSATFRRTSYETERIFNLIYPPKMKYGQGVYHKYVSLYYYGYSSGVPSDKTVGPRGYQHSRFEKYLLQRVTKFKSWIQNIIVSRTLVHFLNIRTTGEKMLVFVATTDMADAVAKSLRQEFPLLRIVTFYGSDDDSKTDVCDIIVSTPKKCGVGTDIANLRTLINTISTQASEQIEQWFGRLREIKGTELHFVQLYDRFNTNHLRHIAVHKDICQALAAKCFDYTLD